MEVNVSSLEKNFTSHYKSWYVVFFFLCFSDSILELSVMPKDEDILQLVCLWSFFMKNCDLCFFILVSFSDCEKRISLRWSCHFPKASITCMSFFWLLLVCSYVLSIHDYDMTQRNLCSFWLWCICFDKSGPASRTVSSA